MKPDQQPFQPQQDQPEPIDWERFRAETAAKAMQSILVGDYIWDKSFSGSNYGDKPSKDLIRYSSVSVNICTAAIKMADELVKQLKEKKEDEEDV